MKACSKCHGWNQDNATKCKMCGAPLSPVRSTSTPAKSSTAAPTNLPISPMLGVAGLLFVTAALNFNPVMHPLVLTTGSALSAAGLVRARQESNMSGLIICALGFVFGLILFYMGLRNRG